MRSYSDKLAHVQVVIKSRMLLHKCAPSKIQSSTVFRWHHESLWAYNNTIPVVFRSPITFSGWGSELAVCLTSHGKFNSSRRIWSHWCRIEKGTSQLRGRVWKHQSSPTGKHLAQGQNWSGQSGKSMSPVSQYLLLKQQWVLVSKRYSEW